MLFCTLKIQFKIQFSDNAVILSLLDSKYCLQLLLNAIVSPRSLFSMWPRPEKLSYSCTWCWFTDGHQQADRTLFSGTWGSSFHLHSVIERSAQSHGNASVLHWLLRLDRKFGVMMGRSSFNNAKLAHPDSAAQFSFRQLNISFHSFLLKLSNNESTREPKEANTKLKTPERLGTLRKEQLLTERLREHMQRPGLISGHWLELSTAVRQPVQERKSPDTKQEAELTKSTKIKASRGNVTHSLLITFHFVGPKIPMTEGDVNTF